MIYKCQQLDSTPGCTPPLSIDPLVYSSEVVFSFKLSSISVIIHKVCGHHSVKIDQYIPTGLKIEVVDNR